TPPTSALYLCSDSPPPATAALCPSPFLNFFFNDTPPTEIYTLSLPDALPISIGLSAVEGAVVGLGGALYPALRSASGSRSEEHTSELQALNNVVLRLLAQ